MSAFPKALRDQACAISKTGNTVTIECDDADYANDLFDWLASLSSKDSDGAGCVAWRYWRRGVQNRPRMYYSAEKPSDPNAYGLEPLYLKQDSSEAVLEERAAIVAFMREEAKAQMRICENNARFYGYETAAKAQMFAARYEALADAISRGDHHAAAIRREDKRKSRPGNYHDDTTPHQCIDCNRQYAGVYSECIECGGAVVAIRRGDDA